MPMDYQKVYQKFIDEELAAASGTEWMSADDSRIRWNGGGDVEVATLTTTGLGDYDSTKTDGSAYPAGAVTSEWSLHTLEMDRGVKFALDRVAPEEAAFAASAENVVRAFARTQLAKEQDTFRINKLYQLASEDEAHSDTHILTYKSTDNIINKLCGLVQTLENDSEQSGGFVAMVAADLKNSFLQASANNYNNITFEQKVEINGVEYEHVMMLNDLPCIFVPSSRMNTVIDVQSGRNGQEAGGILAAAGSKRIYAVVAACDAPMAIARIDSLKQFGPDENQLFDGTAIQARYFYDLLVPQDKVVTIGALVEGSN